MRKLVPVIDLFSGPGGLAEGFAAPSKKDGRRRFRVALSIEKDATAHRTLRLRAFLRKFPSERPAKYYKYLNGAISDELDWAALSGADAEGVLDAIWHFLSLAKGSRCDLCCPCGFDASDEQVWSRWSAPREWEPNPLTWFDFNDPSALVDLFPGFMAKWKVDNWRDALNTTIWWYTNAN